MSVLEDKLDRLNKFAQTCDDAGLAEDFMKAAAAAHKFAADCLTFVKDPRDSDEAMQHIVSQHKDATSNLIKLAISANAAGINLHEALREIFDAINELMRTMGLARE